MELFTSYQVFLISGILFCFGIIIGMFYEFTIIRNNYSGVKELMDKKHNE